MKYSCAVSAPLRSFETALRQEKEAARQFLRTCIKSCEERKVAHIEAHLLTGASLPRCSLHRSFLACVALARACAVKSPKAAACEYAQTVSADLVIVGSRGLGALKSALLGSFSQYVLTEAGCPVLLAK